MKKYNCAYYKNRTSYTYKNYFSNKKTKIEEKMHGSICYFNIMLNKNRYLSKEYYENPTNENDNQLQTAIKELIK